MNWLARVRGNARGCLIYEPMFILPYSLYTTYGTVYMLQLGMTTTQIGLVASVSLVLQMISSAISGHVTDRMGRRRALLTFDLVSWSLATLIWMVSQNIWFFVAAAICNSFQKIPNTAWYCLLVEDTDPGDRSTVFTALQLISVVGGLFTPLAGLLIAAMHLVPAVRVMYGIAFLSMTTMFWLRNRAVHETAIGLRKMSEVTDTGWAQTMKQHVDVVREIARSRRVLAVFAVYILNNFQAAVSVTFLSVFEVSALHIPAAWIALFPAVSAIATLLLMGVVMPRLRQEHGLRHIFIGFVLSVGSSAMLIAAPEERIGYIAVASILSATGTVLANPFLETMTANVIRDEERAKFLSVLTVLILLFTWPAGILGGLAYAVNPRLTFVLVAGALVTGGVILLALQRRTPPEIL